MAFVHRAEKKSCLEDDIKKVIPGPGTYLTLHDYQTNKGFAPFASTVERIKPLKKDENAPGPGSYKLVADMTNQAQKLQAAGPNQDPTEVEAPKLSNIFKSTTQRFEDKTKKPIDTPGPGSYHNEESYGKKIKQLPSSNNHKKDILQNMLGSGRYVAIPSIPSTVHGYGYTENESMSHIPRDLQIYL